MSRPLRIEYPGAFYHVMNRGADRRSIFLDPQNHRSLFLRVIGEAAQMWKIRIHAYSLMDNHYHLLMETPLPNLSRAMRHIDGVYTQRLNRDVGRDGPLFRGRFKSLLIQKETYFLELVRYIHLNGVRALQYPHPRLDPNCSHGEYLGGRAKQSWLITDLALSFFDLDQPNVLTRFDEFVRAGVSKELDDVLVRKRWPAILGLKDFALDIRTRFGLARPAHREKPQERELGSVVKLDPERVIVAVATLFEIDPAVLVCRGGKIRARARQMAMHLLRQACYLSYGEIGKIMGGVGSSAAMYGVQRFKKRPLEEDIQARIKKDLGFLFN